MMSPADRLAYMVNQIARNLAAQGFDRAARETADHVTAFWSGPMKAQLLAHESAALDPIAAAAVRILSDRGGSLPPRVARSGGSDAG